MSLCINKRYYTERSLFTLLLILNCLLMLTYIYQDRLLHNSNMKVYLEKKTTRRSTNAFLNRGFDASNIIDRDANDVWLLKNVTPTHHKHIVSNPVTTRIPDEMHVNNGYYNIRNNEALKFHCGHCAVVTNSGQLLNSSAGSSIDDTECVFRMNGAPTMGYEEDVGRRTTARIVGHANIGKVRIIEAGSRKPNMVIIPWLRLTNIDSKNVYFNKAKNLSTNYTDVEFYLFSKDKVNISEQIFKEETGISTREDAHTWLSTGWMTLIFALDVCDRIDVYGLVPENHCRKLKNWNNSASYHYYGPKFKNECDYYNSSEIRLLGGHKFLTEKAVYAKWSQKYDINFYHPTWEGELETSNNTLLDSPYLRRYHEALENGDMKNAIAELEKKNKRHERMAKTRDIIRRRKEARIKQRNKVKRRITMLKGRTDHSKTLQRAHYSATSNKAPATDDKPPRNQTISKMTVFRNFKNIDIGR